MAGRINWKNSETIRRIVFIFYRQNWEIIKIKRLDRYLMPLNPVGIGPLTPGSAKRWRDGQIFSGIRDLAADYYSRSNQIHNIIGIFLLGSMFSIHVFRVRDIYLIVLWTCLLWLSLIGCPLPTSSPIRYICLNNSIYIASTNYK